MSAVTSVGPLLSLSLKIDKAYPLVKNCKKECAELYELVQFFKDLAESHGDNMFSHPKGRQGYETLKTALKEVNNLFEECSKMNVLSHLLRADNMKSRLHSAISMLQKGLQQVTHHNVRLQDDIHGDMKALHVTTDDKLVNPCVPPSVKAHPHTAAALAATSLPSDGGSPAGSVSGVNQRPASTSTCSGVDKLGTAAAAAASGVAHEPPVSAQAPRSTSGPAKLPQLTGLRATFMQQQQQQRGADEAPAAGGTRGPASSIGAAPTSGQAPLVLGAAAAASHVAGCTVLHGCSATHGATSATAAGGAAAAGSSPPTLLPVVASPAAATSSSSSPPSSTVGSSKPSPAHELQLSSTLARQQPAPAAAPSGTAGPPSSPSPVSPHSQHPLSDAELQHRWGVQASGSLQHLVFTGLDSTWSADWEAEGDTLPPDVIREATAAAAVAAHTSRLSAGQTG